MAEKIVFCPRCKATIGKTETSIQHLPKKISAIDADLILETKIACPTHGYCRTKCACHQVKPEEMKDV